MANEQPYDLHREFEAMKSQQEAHGRMIRENTEGLSEVKAELRAHGLDVAQLTGTATTGFEAMDKKLDIVIDLTRPRPSAFSRLVDRLDNKTIIIVALIVGAVALIGFGGASAFRAGFAGAEIGVTSEQPAVEGPAPER